MSGNEGGSEENSTSGENNLELENTAKPVYFNRLGKDIMGGGLYVQASLIQVSLKNICKWKPTNMVLIADRGVAMYVRFHCFTLMGSDLQWS